MHTTDLLPHWGVLGGSILDFCASAPESQRGTHDAQETVDSIWVSPQQALARHAENEFGLVNVTRIQLEWLSEYTNKQDLPMSKAATFPTRRLMLPVKD